MNNQTSFQQFQKIEKRITLAHYFAHRKQEQPGTPVECARYWKEHGEWPMTLLSENPAKALWEIYTVYERKYKMNTGFVTYQTAQQIAKLAHQFSKPNSVALDMCCGFGMICYALNEAGHSAVGFDTEHDFIESARILINEEIQPGASFFQEDMNEIDDMSGAYDLIVSYPPFGSLVRVFEAVDRMLTSTGTAVLLLPSLTTQRQSPGALVGVMHRFEVHAIEQPEMKDEEGLEIVVLKRRVMGGKNENLAAEREETMLADMESRINYDRF